MTRMQVCLILTGLMVCLLAPVAATAKTLLAVFAHPDDELLIGPLLATYGRRGVSVQLVVVTNGEKGISSHAGIPEGPGLVKIRAEEVRCSSRALGIESPILLDFKDGELGQISSPPWNQLGQVERELRMVFAKTRPDAIVTFGPEGGYGHPDHRLVGAVVTQLVQAGVDGAPALYYLGFPKDRLPKMEEGGVPWFPTERRFLTVRVPYDDKDLEMTRLAYSCHKSQFKADEVATEIRWLHQVLGGTVHLRPWFGAAQSEDVFTPQIQ